MSKVVEATLLDVDLPAEPRSASRARRAVLDALRGIAVDRDAVGVVVSEAVTNAVVHAYRDREQPGPRARVREPGRRRRRRSPSTTTALGMRPRADSPGVGLGMPLIGDLADRVEISEPRPRARAIAAHFALMGAAGPHGRAAGAPRRRARRTAPARLVAV